jgi:energy-coupling factor transporter ATP-binding protein EcfA2
MSQEDVDKRRKESIFLIKLHDRHSQLYKYMRMLLPSELVDAMFNAIEEFDEGKYMAIHQYLSSGQSMLMNLIIEIVANIRHNTLILLDEPEVHLHPKGITKIINILNEICRDFSSCCVLATHSAVIIQELLSRNVIVMDREENGAPIVRPMRVESLGENLTTITEDVFGRSEVPPYYKKMVKMLVQNSRDLNQVLQAIQNNDVPISMPLYMLIDKYFSQK